MQKRSSSGRLKQRKPRGNVWKLKRGRRQQQRWRGKLKNNVWQLRRQGRRRKIAACETEIKVLLTVGKATLTANATALTLGMDTKAEAILARAIQARVIQAMVILTEA